MKKDIGIVINAHLYRNTSQIVKIFLKDNGYIPVYAKGIYKLRKFDFDGPFHIFFKYIVEIHGSIENNDIVLVTSSKCINKINYENIAKNIFLRKLQKFIEGFFILGIREKAVFNFFDIFLNFTDKVNNLHFIHYAYFVTNTFKICGLVNDATLSKLKISKRMTGFIKYLLNSNLMREINTKLHPNLEGEFHYFIKNNFHHYYNTRT